MRKGERRIKVPENRLDILTPRLHCRGITDPLAVPWFLEEQAKMCEHRVRSPYALDLVTMRSIRTVRDAVYVLANYFRREFGYDFVQYSPEEVSHPRDRIFLWTRNEYTYLEAIGAICFRWREYRGGPHDRTLAWVWIHPFLRREGILSAYWPMFRSIYGSYYIDTPSPPLWKAS